MSKLWQVHIELLRGYPVVSLLGLIFNGPEPESPHARQFLLSLWKVAQNNLEKSSYTPFRWPMNKIMTLPLS